MIWNNKKILSEPPTDDSVRHRIFCTRWDRGSPIWGALAGRWLCGWGLLPFPMAGYQKWHRRGARWQRVEILCKCRYFSALGVICGAVDVAYDLCTLCRDEPFRVLHQCRRDHRLCASHSAEGSIASSLGRERSCGFRRVTLRRDGASTQYCLHHKLW